MCDLLVLAVSKKLWPRFVHLAQSQMSLHMCSMWNGAMGSTPSLCTTKIPHDPWLQQIPPPKMCMQCATESLSSVQTRFELTQGTKFSHNLGSQMWADMQWAQCAWWWTTAQMPDHHWWAAQENMKPLKLHDCFARLKLLVNAHEQLCQAVRLAQGDWTHTSLKIGSLSDD